MLPVWEQKETMSFKEPGSVATTLSVSPECSALSDFLVRRIGRGQLPAFDQSAL